MILFLFNLFTLIKSNSLYSTNCLSNSNYFLSNYFNSNSNNFNSNYFNSNSYNSVSLKSSIFNPYLSFVTSNDNKISKSRIYSVSSLSSKIVTLNPSIMPSIRPSIMPSIRPSISPTLIPTLNKKKTLNPTPINVPVISFNTQLSFNNYDTVELDEKSQQVIIIATANSMNLSSTFVKYLGTQIQTRRRLIQIIFKIQGFNIAVSLQTNIPLQGKYSSFVNNPNALYSQITTNLVNSVNSGLFTSYLQAESLNLNITTFSNSTILSVKSDDYVIREPIPKGENRTSNPDTDFKSIIYIILFTTGIAILLKISYNTHTKKEPFGCVKLTSFNLTTTTSDIVITINE
jgi:hypothetical protein